jgi:tetratricopeptide (TPR) repeat protein
MKRAACFCWMIFVLFSCTKKENNIVERSYTDSLLSHYTPSIAAVTIGQDLQFWKKRMDSLPPDLVNKQKYAQALAARFHLTGDINDLVEAESIYQWLNKFYKEKEPGVLLTLAGFSMLRHKFNEAAVYIDSSLAIVPNSFGAQVTWFDAQFELGNYQAAASMMSSTHASKDYGYNFRLSKVDHYNNNIDSGIAHLLKAADLTTSPYLKQLALSNAADLYMHDGRMKDAYRLYKECLQISAADFHSMMGIGWIALVHDRDNATANKIFSFVNGRMKSPDALWKLFQSNEVTNPQLAKKYAEQFAIRVTHPVYGNMYAKYLVELYTGILNDPAKAIQCAGNEVNNRATPQTFTWLAWSLAAGGKAKEAYKIYQEKISGKPLEPLELLWMGKMMMLLGKNYNALKYFEAASKNRYDLGPRYQKELEKLLRELSLPA